jgi:signal transduction histidine kinase
LRLLAEAGELFSTTLDRDEIAARIAQVAVPRLADTCNVYVGSGDRLERIACVSDEPRLQATLESIPASFALDGPGTGVLARVFDTREPVLLATITAEYLADLERLGADPTAFDAIGTRSLMLVPIAARGQSLGVLTLGSRQPERFDEHDLDLAQELAGRAAVAIDSAELFRAVESRAQAAQALEFVGDGVFLVGRDGVIRLWNPAASRITGLKESEVSGAAVAEALAGWPLDQVGERPQTFPIDGPNGELWLSLTAAEFPHGTVYAFRDLTEERAVEQLKSDFVSTVSHELRTPLAAIYGAAMTLRREDVVLGDEQQEAGCSSDRRRVGAARADRQRHPARSRLDSGAAHVEIEPHGRDRARARGAGGCGDAPAAGIELALTAPAQACTSPRPGRAPPGARQPGRERGQVLARRRPVELELEPTDGRVRFAVRDRGLGIPAAEHERIFEKFFRLDPNSRAASAAPGSGLYISREIVRGWAAGSASSPIAGRGSTFSFELPLAEKDERRP